jgi:23S rRNA (uracil1939-C5)-methyltransferase
VLWVSTGQVSFDKIVDIEQCLLQDDFSNEIRNFVRSFAHKNSFTFYDTRAQKGFLRNMIVRNSTQNEWMVIMIFGHHDDEKIPFMMTAILEKFPQITSLNYVINVKVNDTIFDREVKVWSGQPYIVEKLHDVKYQIGPKSFFQTNPRQALRLFNIAVGFAELKVSDNVYDLYTGLGSIAL